jgi:cephalosporin-C deacetylase-like acetyl esterase
MDCVEAKKFLISTGYVDESKIGIIGGSYGGYMVLAALAFPPLPPAGKPAQFQPTKQPEPAKLSNHQQKVGH